MRPRSRGRWAVLVAAGTLAAFASGCDDYGTKMRFNGGDLYYTSPIDANLAEKLGNYLVKVGFFNGQSRSAQIKKPDKAYQFRMVVKEGTEEQDVTRSEAKELARMLSENVFDGAPVEVHLCDKYLRTLPNNGKIEP
jgi:hypothetical protein